MLRLFWHAALELEDERDAHQPTSLPAIYSSPKVLDCGFTAPWCIEENRLLLVAITADPCRDQLRPFALKRVFRRNRGASPVIAEWFTSVGCVPQGQRVEHIHAGFVLRYERNLLLQIERGRVMHRWEEPDGGQP